MGSVAMLLEKRQGFWRSSTKMERAHAQCCARCRKMRQVTGVEPITNATWFLQKLEILFKWLNKNQLPGCTTSNEDPETLLIDCSILHYCNSLSGFMGNLHWGLVLFLGVIFAVGTAMDSLSALSFSFFTSCKHGYTAGQSINQTNMQN